MPFVLDGFSHLQLPVSVGGDHFCTNPFLNAVREAILYIMAKLKLAKKKFKWRFYFCSLLHIPVLVGGDHFCTKSISECSQEPFLVLWQNLKRKRNHFQMIILFKFDMEIFILLDTLWKLCQWEFKWKKGFHIKLQTFFTFANGYFSTFHFLP